MVIVGCGRVGSRVALELSVEGEEVILIDRDPASLNKAAARGLLASDFKGTVVVGDGCDAELLRRAGIEGADVFIAVTEGDNRNIMAAQIAQHVFKVPRVVARIYDPIREAAYQKMGLSSFCPTIEGSRQIREMIKAS